MPCTLLALSCSLLLSCNLQWIRMKVTFEWCSLPFSPTPGHQQHSWHYSRGLERASSPLLMDLCPLYISSFGEMSVEFHWGGLSHFFFQFLFQEPQYLQCGHHAWPSDGQSFMSLRKVITGTRQRDHLLRGSSCLCSPTRSCSHPLSLHFFLEMPFSQDQWVLLSTV